MTVDAPQPRDMGQESRDSLQAQVDIAPQQYAAQAKFSPMYNDLQMSNLRSALLGDASQPGLVKTLGDVTPAMQDIASQSQSRQRAADLADVQKYGADTVAAIRGADPTQKALLDKINAQVASGLDAGSSLTPDQESYLAQRVRAAQASRGVGFGNSDATAEAFTLGDRGLALQQQRLQNAQNVAGLNANTGADPLLAVLGRPSQAPGSSQSLLNQGSQTVAASGTPSFNPFNAYAQDLFNTNYNGNAAANIAGTNATASVVAGGLSAL